MYFQDFWYIIALSDRLRPNQLLARTVLDEWLVIFRGKDGQPVALRDRCLHRNSRLSCGTIHAGTLHCPYHGWVYDQTGKVVAVPSEGKSTPMSRQAQRYATCEQDGYVYVRLAEPQEAIAPFAMPHFGERGWETVRLVNRFANNVTNCAENFIDVPHTASVHPGVFRTAQRQPLHMRVERRDGSVWVTYQKETTNLGWFRHFLNRHGKEIAHVDRFHMPNITCVEYNMGDRQLLITSQSVPETERSTLVYTDVTFNYGRWNKLARPLVRWTAQHIINQDIQVLKGQGEAIAKYGTHFVNTPVDTVHGFVESIRGAIEMGKDPRELPDKTVEVKFWV
jgi:phenylpropionate dioxygenase-like ring-hydroxylating dioxygenase large terminal subunit